MKRKLVIVLLTALLLISLTGCSMLGFGSSSTTKPPVTTTSPNIMERIGALESQISSLNLQLAVLNSDNVSLKARLDNDEKIISSINKGSSPPATTSTTSTRPVTTLTTTTR